jgi:ArsR family transcriptional regulator, arsenate/arsenite/antimonite-responsive transcriptional repressor
MRAAAPTIDHVFRALADPTRLRILQLLSQGELCVCDIVDGLDVPQPKASRHLAYLRRAGLVLARKEGLWSYYRLAPARTAFEKELHSFLAACFRQLPPLPSRPKGRRCC